jgi:hypothetical protein
VFLAERKRLVRLSGKAAARALEKNVYLGRIHQDQLRPLIPVKIA